jgi:hypothetical protein
VLRLPASIAIIREAERIVIDMDVGVDRVDGIGLSMGLSRGASGSG